MTLSNYIYECEWSPKISDEFFVGSEVNEDGEMEIRQLKANLAKLVFQAMSAKLTNDGLLERCKV
jgi:hypothetical protein